MSAIRLGINLLWPPRFGWEAQLVERFDPATSFGPDVSQRYDDHLRGDEDETVDLFADLAGCGSALEFAIGTGRIAIPLTQRDSDLVGAACWNPATGVLG